MFRLQDQLDACPASVFSTNDGVIFMPRPSSSGDVGKNAAVIRNLYKVRSVGPWRPV